MADRRTTAGRRLVHALIWCLAGALVFVSYSFRDEAAWVLDRVRGDLSPGTGYAESDRGISFRARRDGHFVIEALADGIPLRMMVDTGASDVVLSPADAGRLGIDTSSLAFVRPYETANGVVLGAPVTLGQLRIGPVVVANLRASVIGTPLETSLLGMSFLSRTGGWEVRGDSLTLFAR